MRTTYITLVLLVCSTFLAGGAGVSDRLLDCIEQVESRGNPLAVGRAGERGAFQFRAAAWMDVTHWRRARGYRTWQFTCASDRTVARLYARDYLIVLRQRLTQHHIKPDALHLYAAYNLGFNGYKKRGFRLRYCPSTTQQSAYRVRRLLEL